MEISNNGLNLIKQFEGFRPEPYPDVVGLLTIGYGHLIKPGEKFTVINGNQALDLLRSDCETAVSGVNRLTTTTLNQNQFDALVSFTFNLGVKTYLNSSLRTEVNLGDFDLAQQKFKLYVYAGGKISPGLVNRRKAEATLFGTSV